MPTRTKYDSIFAQLKATPYEWVTLDPDAVAGKFSSQKQSTLVNAARVRGVRIKTRYHLGGVFMACLDHSTDSFTPSEKDWKDLSNDLFGDCKPKDGVL